MNRHQRLQGAMLDVAKRIGRFCQPDQPQINEANTKNWLIEPLLRAMGWDTQDPGAVQAEYRAVAHELNTRPRQTLGWRTPTGVHAPDVAVALTA